MIRSLASKFLLTGLVAGLGALAVAPSAEAATARLRFTPPYGQPFPDLEWFGEAVIDDGGCSAVGSVLNFSDCGGSFKFVSASVSFANVANPSVALETLNFTPSSAQVAFVERTTTNPNTWSSVYSSPFAPLQSSISETLYNGSNAYFSLIFVGDHAQLYWFKNDPGAATFDPFNFPYGKLPNSIAYLGCYQTGENRFFGNKCGISSGGEDGAAGARLSITVVPEPSAYLMALGALGVLGFMARRRQPKA